MYVLWTVPPSRTHHKTIKDYNYYAIGYSLPLALNPNGFIPCSLLHERNLITIFSVISASNPLMEKSTPCSFELSLGPSYCSHPFSLPNCYNYAYQPGHWSMSTIEFIGGGL
jgi:hypothetical protein